MGKINEIGEDGIFVESYHEVSNSLLKKTIIVTKKIEESKLINCDYTIYTKVVNFNEDRTGALTLKSILYRKYEKLNLDEICVDYSNKPNLKYSFSTKENFNIDFSEYNKNQISKEQYFDALNVLKQKLSELFLEPNYPTHIDDKDI